MGKFTAIQTYDRFLRLWEQNEVNDRSLNFILDTGQLYTHGIFLNSVAYGTEANGAVLLTIAGTQKTLSLSNHTHLTYLEKNADIDLGSYKIVSGQKDLLYYSGGNTYLGNTTSPAVILGTSLSTVRSDTTYTVLDTGNFSIGNTTTAGYTLLNVAVFKYGSNSFQLDYVKRVNTSSTFDALAAYTSAGTTQVNNKLYGVITLYTDGTILSPSWAQFRVDIADQLVLFRTSKDSTEWINLNQIEVPLNALNVAGSVAAPTSADANKVWKTDGSGNPAWRADSGNTWRNIRINDEESDSLDTGTGTGALYIKQGTGITVSWSGNKIVIANSAPDTWKAANNLQEGYVPKLDGSGTISTQASEYVLTYTSGSGTITPTWKLLPANAFNDTTYSVTDTTGISLSGTTLSLNVGTRDTTNASSAATYVLNRFYQIVTDKDKKLGVVVPWSEGSNTTAIKQAAVTGTKKDDDTLITSDSGLIIQGGTNLIKIGDGTNYIEVPITPSITNNVTGTGTNGKLAKWSGDHTLTDGPGFSNAITTLSLSTKFLREDGTWAAPSYTSSLTFYNLIFKKSDDTTLMTYLPTTSPSKTLKLGSGIGFDLSGDVLTISASDTKYYLTLNGTANGNSGTTNLGTIYAPTTSGTGFLKCTVNNGTITWSYDNSTYNNYSLPTASNSELGGVKTGAAVTDVTGMTAVHIKDGVIYYKDTNTWKAANTSLEGYAPKLELNSTATIATLASEYVLTYKSGTETAPVWRKLPENAFKDTWNAMTGATASNNGTIGYINVIPPKDGYNTKYWRADGTWSTPPNSLYYLSLNGSTNGTENTINLGTIYAPSSSGNGFLKSSVSGNTITWTYEDVLGGHQVNDFYIRNVHMYGLENLVTDITSGGKCSKVGDTIVLLSQTADTFFYLRSYENFEPGATYTVGCYVEGWSGSGSIDFYASNNSTCAHIKITGNGWFWSTGTLIPSGEAATNNLLMDDMGHSNTSAITLSKFVIVRGDIFPYYIPPISKFSVNYANSAGAVAWNNITSKPNALGSATQPVYWDGSTFVEANSYPVIPTFYNLIFNNGTLDILTYDPDGSVNKKIIKGDNITFTVNGNNLTISATNTWTANAVGVAGYVAAPTKANNANMVWKCDADGNPGWRTDTDTWDAVNTSLAGYVPKLATGEGTITSSDVAYVLAYKSGVQNTTTPVWILLPENAYKNDNTWTAADTSNAGYVPKSIKGKYLHANDTTGALEWVDDRYAANTDKTGVKKGTAGATDINNGSVISVDSSTGITFEGGTNQFKVGNGTNSITIGVAHGLTTFVKSGTNAASGLVPKPDTTAGTTKFLREDGTWQVPSYTSLPTFYDLAFNNGTSDVLTYDPDGSTSKTIKKGDYISFTVSGNVLTISSLDTWIAWAGATSSNGGTAGYMPAPGTGHRNDFLRGDGTWCSLATPDYTYSANRAAGNVSKDSWGDAVTLPDAFTDGTYVLLFTENNCLYSGVFSYKTNNASSDNAEEISLHMAGPNARRLYARTYGKKILIVTADNTFSMALTTFYFRKLI